MASGATYLSTFMLPIFVIYSGPFLVVVEEIQPPYLLQQTF